MTTFLPKERQKKIQSITLWAIFLNIFLMALKIISGLLVKSSALIADGVHSLSDLSTDFLVLISTRLSSRPADRTHPYGHGKLDTISSLVIGTVLLFISIGLIWSAAVSIYRREHNFPGIPVAIVAIVSVLSKEVLFFLTRRVALLTRSTALYANAWHQRSDSLSSVAVLIGGIAGLLGWGHADQAATVVVGFMIIGVTGKIFWDCLIELSEHSADSESIRKIERVLADHKDIVSWHALRTRKMGAELIIDAHILVNPALSVLESHKISMEIEKEIKKALARPANILIHMEPDIAEMQKEGKRYV